MTYATLIAVMRLHWIVSAGLMRMADMRIRIRRHCIGRHCIGILRLLVGARHHTEGAGAEKGQPGHEE